MSTENRPIWKIILTKQVFSMNRIPNKLNNVTKIFWNKFRTFYCIIQFLFENSVYYKAIYINYITICMNSPPLIVEHKLSFNISMYV